MPEPLLYAQAMGVAAITSSVFVFVMIAVRRSVITSWLNAVCVVGLGLGLVTGYAWLGYHRSFPPTSGLDRLLMIVVPVTLFVELIATSTPISNAVSWLLRIVVAIAIPRILLHKSVYLNVTDDWTAWQANAMIAVSGILLVIVWGALSCVTQRSGGISIAFALCLAIQCAGTTVMLAGYIKGGAAAIPLAATVFGVSAASRVSTRYLRKDCEDRLPNSFLAPAIIALGVVGLFGLLFVGRFFGEISTMSALTILFAPVLCCVSEAPQIRNQKPWVVALLRVVLVAIPLTIVLVAAKREFDREMLPLLGDGIVSPQSQGCRSLRVRNWEESSQRELMSSVCVLDDATDTSRQRTRQVSRKAQEPR
ncbi:hypothetical protein [Stieleria varia]|uniref:Uncharacterized protein n=1 Tax=Stieleria varia TaxID=2528005 RepID=A0A5C6B563_9BACT|nr:hypothetical protein [Stieleria varia]TWU06416.1 hypothetical protein Pla52n_21370 [Stieleria varia]